MLYTREQINEMIERQGDALEQEDYVTAQEIENVLDSIDNSQIID